MHIWRKFSYFLSLLVVSDFVITDEEEFLEKPIEGKAKFKTLPIHVMVNEGETIKLPCFVDKIEGYVLLWKFADGDNLLSVGSRVVSADLKKRVKLEEKQNGNYLIIDSATSEDSGNYDCHISDYEPLEIRHSVIVRTRPEVTVDQRQVEVMEGEDARLTCRAVAGTPAPEISWLRNGSVVVFSEELLMKNVSRQDSGGYSCRADNGYSEDHTVSVHLSVLHPPFLVNSSPDWVHAGSASNLILFCEVSSLPPAELFWLNEDTQLYSRVQANSSDSVQLWSLDVGGSSELQEDQQYWCIANNSLGVTRKRMTLTNKPSKPVLKINKTSNVVSWTVESGANLTSTLLELSESQGKTRQISVNPVETEPGYWTGSWIVNSDFDAKYNVRVRAISEDFGAGPFCDWKSLETSAGSRVQFYVICLSLSLLTIL